MLFKTTIAFISFFGFVLAARLDRARRLIFSSINVYQIANMKCLFAPPTRLSSLLRLTVICPAAAKSSACVCSSLCPSLGCYRFLCFQPSERFTLRLLDHYTKPGEIDGVPDHEIPVKNKISPNDFADFCHGASSCFVSGDSA